MPCGRHICSTDTAEREGIVGRDRRHVALYFYPSAVEPRVHSPPPVSMTTVRLLARGDRVWHRQGSIFRDNGGQIADASLGVGP